MQLDFSFIKKALLEISKAIPLTLFITIVPLLCGLLIGIIVAFIRLGQNKPLQAIANFYVSFYRGTPVILHIFVIYFGLPQISKAAFNISLAGWPVVTFVIIALTLNAGAFLSEIIRSGIISVSVQQTEAAASLGMTGLQVFRRIVLPQAFVTIIPNLTNMFIGFLHASSIAFLVSVQEMMGIANIIAASNLKYLEAFIAAGIMYWVITVAVELFAGTLERKLTAHLRQGVVQQG
ncbi:amino acid ABC transporter permease [Metasolibacillus meyeri]|uniref:Amino acid ABC transporter permease n=1 Tax=Metasolibacillus meyeri TaxID=1071052 RepID=A0AAW9NWD0_9BACL|nr:amino acid ABC transporter permease [Metasolibacillus meyeri]MEC1179611.1 amino acid ABC transporter permease [Metasolibacillus meyeri]